MKRAAHLPSRIVCVCFCLALLTAIAFGAGFTLEQVLSSPFPSNLVAAEHSGRIAWAVNAKGIRNLWIADAPQFSARQVTHYGSDDGQGIANLRITPDGRTLVYVLGSEANEDGVVADPTNGVSRRKQQVWALDVDGGDPRSLGEMDCGHEGCENVQISPDGQFAAWATKKQLWIAPVSGATPSHQLTEIKGDNFDPHWSPDGRQIAFVSDRSGHSFIAIYEFGRDSVRYLSPSVDKDVMPRWSPDGQRLAFLRLRGKAEKVPLIPLHPTPWSIWVADSANGTAKELWHSGERLTDSLPEVTEEPPFFFTNHTIVFSSEQDNRNHLYAIAAAGGSPKLLTPGEFDIEDACLSSDRNSVIYSSNQDDVDRRHIWRVGVTSGPPQALTKGETIEWSPVETGVDGQVVSLGSSATTPGMPYHITPQGRQMIGASALPSDFPSQQLVTPKQVVFKSEDGLEIHGQLFIPAGRTTAGPALIFTHGGPPRQMMLGFHYMNYYSNAYAMNQYLASRGYVVLSVNYRLGIMYGQPFRVPENAVWRGASEYRDVMAGAKYLLTLPIVDGRRIGLWGGSYGGFLTAMGLARNSDVFAAGVDFHGVHDWSMFLPRWEATGGAPDLEDAKKLAFESSPDSAVGTWKSPVLLIHGDDDRNVPFGQTVELAQRLRKQGVEFEELIFPDEIHDFLLWRSWIRSYKATAEFFDRKLK